MSLFPALACFLRVRHPASLAGRFPRLEPPLPGRATPKPARRRTPTSYASNALELYRRLITAHRVLCQRVMRLHHTKHHQTYVNALDYADARSRSRPRWNSDEVCILSISKRPVSGLPAPHPVLSSPPVPPSPPRLDDYPAQGLAPPFLEEPHHSCRRTSGVLKDDALKQPVDVPFESLVNLKEFNPTTLEIQGFGGWGWLGYNTQTKRLEIATTANQAPLPSLVSIIGVDIWEDAFYLQYLNVKADDLTAIWSVINFEEAEARYLEAAGASTL